MKALRLTLRGLTWYPRHLLRLRSAPTAYPPGFMGQRNITTQRLVSFSPLAKRIAAIYEDRGLGGTWMESEVIQNAYRKQQEQRLKG